MKRGILIILMSLMVFSAMAQVKSFTMMSYTFDEQKVLSEIAKQLIENKLGIKVNLKDESGGAMIAHTALLTNDIQARVSYSGTEFSTVMQQTITKEFLDPKVLLDWVKVEALKRFGFIVTDSIGFNNTYAIAVKREFAEKNNIKTISDLVKFTPNMVIAVDSDFYNRDGVLSYSSLSKTYGFKFKKEVSMDYSLMYRAIETGDVNAIIAYSTEGKVKSLDLKLLIDDKKVFPPYDGIYVIRKDLVDKDPRILEVFKSTHNLLNNEEMQELNLKANMGEDIPTFVREFLIKKGKLK